MGEGALITSKSLIKIIKHPPPRLLSIYRGEKEKRKKAEISNQSATRPETGIESSLQTQGLNSLTSQPFRDI